MKNEEKFVSSILIAAKRLSKVNEAVWYGYLLYEFYEYGEDVKIYRTLLGNSHTVCKRKIKRSKSSLRQLAYDIRLDASRLWCKIFIEDLCKLFPELKKCIEAEIAARLL